jgi:hypothetical protein
MILYCLGFCGLRQFSEKSPSFSLISDARSRSALPSEKVMADRPNGSEGIVRIVKNLAA